MDKRTIVCFINEMKDKLFYLLKKNNKTKLIYSDAKNSSKTIITQNERLQLSCNSLMQINDVEAKAREIIKNYINNSKGLLKYIKSKKTPVIKARYINIPLFLVNEAEGFIPAFKGIKAFLLSASINILSKKHKIKVGFKTPAMFILRDKPVNFYILMHQFYHWMAYINGLPGYEDKNLKNFKNLWKNQEDNKCYEKLSFEEMMGVKDSISRDIAAINFVKQISREFVGTKNSVKKLRDGKAVNI